MDHFDKEYALGKDEDMTLERKVSKKKKGEDRWEGILREK